jgi:hypothetical protein
LSARLPNSYAGDQPPYAWNVPTLTLCDSRRITSDRNGTNGSWKWRTSKRSWSRSSRTWDTNRGETVTVPTEPLAGIEKPFPRRMTSPSEARWRPWDEVRMRTVWPRWRRFSYR